MTPEQQHVFEELLTKEKSISTSWVDYWHQFSNAQTWQFWFNLALLLLPLVVLWFALDRKKALQIGFYGFSIHMMATYIHMFGERNYIWAFPYKIVPYLPTSITLDASFNPIVLMLVYQWTLNHKKNYYLYSAIMCALFSFVFKPLLSVFDLFHLYGRMNYFYLFLLYFLVTILAKLITDLFVSFQKNSHHA
ncbi:CBO0543 family protein [Paenibacillus sp. GCM10023248]|uniref:CBO0543 family protein n=1 Tax=Bacillales TaxID=1385 RepID=UPI00237898A1|nr:MULTISPECIES: CBO0543 family protein [Bacillales]MDD9265736.1 hypothetical protein [Paenibacillus sp. MAHUQ-63]MDR6878977.1 hypothetical protein [Bacillus sp. 3255]